MDSLKGNESVAIYSCAVVVVKECSESHSLEEESILQLQAILQGYSTKLVQILTNRHKSNVHLFVVIVFNAGYHTIIQCLLVVNDASVIIRLILAMYSYVGYCSWC